MLVQYLASKFRTNPLIIKYVEPLGPPIQKDPVFAAHDELAVEVDKTTELEMVLCEAVDEAENAIEMGAALCDTVYNVDDVVECEAVLCDEKGLK